MYQDVSDVGSQRLRLMRHVLQPNLAIPAGGAALTAP